MQTLEHFEISAKPETIRVSALRTRNGQTIPYEHKRGCADQDIGVH